MKNVPFQKEKQVVNPEFTNWDPLSVDALTNLLKDLSSDWGVAGGNAIEIFVDRSFRNHGDIDILIQREDQFIFQEY